MHSVALCIIVNSSQSLIFYFCSNASAKYLKLKLIPQKQHQTVLEHLPPEWLQKTAHPGQTWTKRTPPLSSATLWRTCQKSKSNRTKKKKNCFVQLSAYCLNIFLFFCRQWKVVHEALCEPVSLVSLCMNIHTLYNWWLCIARWMCAPTDLCLLHILFYSIMLFSPYKVLWCLFLHLFTQNSTVELGHLCSNIVKAVTQTTHHHLLPALSKVLGVPLRSLVESGMAKPSERSHWYVQTGYFVH